MKDKKRLTIGFLIHHLDNDYSKTLLKGAVRAAEESDVNLIVFPGRSLNCQLDDKKHAAFEYQHNTIYSYVSERSLDAAVVSAGTIGSFVSKEEFKTFLDQYENIPIITTENKVRGYPCVRMSGSGIKDIVRHLVKEHGRKNIAFVSGPKGNADADERLAFYREALEENGLEFDPQMVAYGKFSEYCVDIVGELIDRNDGKIDAICFANDMMCKGGYKAIEKRGLKVGKDIAVTGYDDSEIASVLKPMLTTVRADASKVGYSAVMEAIKLAGGEPVDEIISLSSSPVFRNSCGREMLISQGSSVLTSLAGSCSPEKLAGLIITEYIPDTADNYEAAMAVDALKAMMTSILELPSAGKRLQEKMDACRMYGEKLSDRKVLEVLNPEAVMNIIRAVRIASLHNCKDQESEMAVFTVISNWLELSARIISALSYIKVDDITSTHFLINNITKDMTVYGSDEDKCYFSIVNNLYRMHMLSSFIYTYDETVIHTEHIEWKRPNTVQLRSCHDGDKLMTIASESCELKADDIFINRFTPDRRRTMVVSPLFMNEEHYGVIVCEPEFEYFSYIYSITPQICTAIKLTKLVSQLESSLDAAQYRNSILNRISMYDELTGVYNRRGFYEFTNRIFRAPENEGRHAVLLFGDLDNLKKINDTFGHDDGDYAITSAASYLKNGLRNTDIVARIGGDEFAAFALCDEKDYFGGISERIKDIAAAHNAKSTKAYNVTISIGIYELTCAPDKSIQNFMDKADAALYADKKKKNRDILKQGFTIPDNTEKK